MRRTVRPNTAKLLVVVIALLAFTYWALTELGRFHWVRVVVTTASLAVFCFFAHGWVTR